MELITLCTVAVSLTVHPNRSQFFQYESLSLICEQQGNSSEWRVKRNTSHQENEVCPPSLSGRDKSDCSLKDLYYSDSGVYWCESAAGQRSSSINITVTEGPVILESPVHPVNEGEAVTLRCKHNPPSSSAFIRFYKDELLIGNSSAGNLSIQRFSRCDQGLYKCAVSGVGESPGSWLVVRGHLVVSEVGCCDAETSHFAHVVFPVLLACLVLMSLVLFYLWRSRKGQMKSAVSYTDVFITQDLKPPRIRDVDTASTYSTLRLETN